MRKELAIVGSLMLVAAVAPFAMAHNDTGAPTISGSSTNGGTTNVYGSYTGASGVLVQNVPEVGTVGSAIMLCDAEVQHSGDPTGASGTITEQRVDDAAAKSTNTQTTPDGLFDDGGQGGACHTFDHYTNADWNTETCPTNEVLAGPDVFAIASCDWEITDSEGFVTCIVNAILGNRPGDIVNDCPGRLNPGSPNPGQFIACGTDASGDTATSGLATSSKDGAFFAPGVPPNPNNCDNSTASQAVFVVESADAGAPSVSPAVTGWIGVNE